MLGFQIMFTSFDRNAAAKRFSARPLASVGKKPEDLGYVVSTGYGRKAFLRADKNIPEIIAHAVGTVAVKPGVRTIIDIGGQDSKVIELDENGIVSRFEMNDKCARRDRTVFSKSWPEGF